MPRGIHTSKRQSGFQQRKAKKAKMDEIQSMSGSLFKYVTKADSGQSSSKVPESPADESNDSHLGDSHSDSNIDNTESMKTTQDLDGIKINNENDAVNATFGDSISFEESVQHLRDVSHWSLPVPDNVRIDIIKKGSEHFQNKEGPFPTVSRHGSKIKGDSRHLSQEWFYKPMPSGEKILRSWMVFSPISNNLYCFCCRLFAVSNIQTTFTTGFQKWWKLNPKVLDHETSCEHLENFEKWKTLEMRLKSHTTIDDAALQLMNTEKQKWKNLLSRLLDITLFLAKQNLAFRGHDETKASSNKGNFLELVKLLSKYDAVLKEHILYLEQEKSPKVTYLSPEIQNEFINVLANHVKCQLVNEIKSAKYFGIMFDSTPDVSHVDQMSEVIRYVKIDNRKVEVKEVFLGFFPLHGKKAADLSAEILKKLENDGLDIMMCRSQGYDNAAVMSGIHGGVQAIIKEKNNKAIFIGCIDHSINLCGQHSFAQNVTCVTFFGAVETIFNFFSTSTSRWEVLLNHSKASVKRLSTTRWSAHYGAVKVLAENFDGIISAIEELCDQDVNLETRGAAQNLMPAVCNFSFLCFLFFWNDVLREVNNAQIALQSKGLCVDEIIIKLEALRLFIGEKRLHLAEEAIDFAVQKSEKYNISMERRIRRKKRMPGELASSTDAGLTLRAELQKDMLECIDRFNIELETRVKSIKDVASLFEVVQSKTLLSANTEQLKLAISKFTNLYDEVSETELLLEIPRLRRHLKAANITVSNWVILDFLKFIVEWDFTESLPNLTVALKLFITICASVASCERSFSKLKLIKNYLRSTMTETRLNNLGILTIEHEATQNINFEDVISEFASVKARRKKF